MAKTYKKGKKLGGGSILSVRDFKEGVVGIVGEIKQLFKQDNTPITGSFGQLLHTVELTDPSTGEVQNYWADGGLRGALKLAKVQPNTPYFITHTGETEMELPDGKKGFVQTYEIAEAVAE